MPSQTRPAHMPPGWRHEARGDVQSTNTLAIEAARVGDAGNLWITGERQLAGRGRQGRAWVSEPGNLYASALLRTTPTTPGFGVLPLVVGLSVCDALGSVVPAISPMCSLKWPNDVLVGGAKVAGILIEAESVHGQLAVAIGCGINLVHAPTDTPYRAVRIADHGPAPSPDSMLEALARSLVVRLDQSRMPGSTAEVVRQWRAVAEGLGKPIRVRLPREEITGRFADLDDQGYLILEQDDGSRRRIAAGDVFFEGS